MKIILTIKEAEEIIRERYKAQSCSLKNEYDYDRHFELELKEFEEPPQKQEQQK